jgi:cytochrome c-type biogenesis protein CcsB
MKRLFPWLILALGFLWLASNCRLPKHGANDFDLLTFGKIPVLVGGRQKPMDTVARNSLVIIHGKQTLRMEGKTLDATAWLADTLFNSPVADKYPNFVINNPDVLGSFGWQQTDRKYFSYAELVPFLTKIDEEGKKVDDVESAKRTQYQIAISNLRNSMLLYQRLKNSLQPQDAIDFASELDAFIKVVPEGLSAAGKREKNEAFDKEKLDLLARFTSRFGDLANFGYILPIPPDQSVRAQGGAAKDEWLSMGSSLLRSISSRQLDPNAKAYASMASAFRAGNVAGFNQQVHELYSWLTTNESNATSRASFEYFFNLFAPFYQAMGLYVLAFLMVCGSWLSIGEWSRSFSRAACLLLLLGLAVHTFGLGSRMYLQGRPPVTNLYSSAVFIGWGTVIIGLILERIYRDGIGAICAATIGFITLIIAHHLASNGDTLEMLQAVLDTNIWLATHVVTITIGYSAMFFAGLLAMLYVILGVFTTRLNEPLSRSEAIFLGGGVGAAATIGVPRNEPASKVLGRMTYGIICFATLFSFVGTVLGGIWADQSWGRFWGWDPKENGALLIVLWCAVILHARWGGFIRQRGLMIMCLIGNIITSFSWFGVNMLGVGLHSYGFMNKAMPWLAGFMIANLVLAAIASFPKERWKSFRPASAA